MTFIMTCAERNDACRKAAAICSGGSELTRTWQWFVEEQPTALWARRYREDFDAAINFLNR